MLNLRRVFLHQTVRDLNLCLFCSSWKLSLVLKRDASNASSLARKTPPGRAPDKSVIDDRPPAPGEDAGEEFTPKPLARPLGMLKPPKAGENSGIDARTWRQRREDFFNYEKHMERRKILYVIYLGTSCYILREEINGLTFSTPRPRTKKISTPYFREWTNMRHHKGKTFLSNLKLFRADRALYFPNLRGRTLLSSRHGDDTTPILRDKISVVSVFSSTWAERQIQTFVSEKENPDLSAALRESDGLARRVDVNVEENTIKASLIRLFMPNIRRLIPRDRHGRYFLVRRGISEEIRDAIGFVNGKVGYVYLLDGECRIRWAGSGRAKSEEKESLVRGVRKLVDECKRLREGSAVV
ncbi:hypothetical protein GP486_000514 [Trichoglossum hirsutum]|uniref:Mitochondrial ATPase complex subunit ATP10 n=1 Tax=Trichoglossum hirsutum TaxID=265104 RepID=A0A9P8LIE3_9PEZI|nr:hypothetical protein GP486_000514 [Trichoglossum hirsutum]